MIRGRDTQPLKFQDKAIENGREILSETLSAISRVRGDRQQEARQAIIADAGTILIEAPTGSGKTLIATLIADSLCDISRPPAAPMLWFWFAPFAGVVDQARRSISREAWQLRPRDVATEREPTELRPGDVYVTTWSAVSGGEAKVLRARSRTESNLSLAELIEFARGRGFRIGAVVDEAHHSLRPGAQAFRFWRDVLRPDVTILATATPRDRDLDLFKRAAGLGNVRRISVSRQQAVSEGLIKKGVRAALFKAPEGSATMIDFERTAIKQAVLRHRLLKQLLQDDGVPMTPLMLIQVGSGAAAVREAAEALKELGFREQGEGPLFRIHTAAEPDAGLLTLAADDRVEALIFKMAVATGFDVPRAFTLVSLRPARDPDFGIQVVGRILRVDRRLQGRAHNPQLDYGYVFLADHESQRGLTDAAQRINAVRDELASVTSNIAVVTIDAGNVHAIPAPGGQPSLMSLLSPSSELDGSSEHHDAEGPFGPSRTSSSSPWLWDEADISRRSVPPGARGGADPLAPDSGYIYKLRSELGAPAAFTRAVIEVGDGDLAAEVCAQFDFDDSAMLAASRTSLEIIRQEVEIFSGVLERDERVQASLAAREIAKRAQLNLFSADPYEQVDIRRLHERMLGRFTEEVGRHGLGDNFDTPEKLAQGLDRIFALAPDKLRRAISATLARRLKSEQAANLPDELISIEPLRPSRKNLYGVFPADLNAWEVAFAEYLEGEADDVVLWWHRNPDRKPWSVRIPLPGQPNYHPDFVAGIRDRTRGGGVLLVETKRVINDEGRNAQAKAVASHPLYERVLMLYQQQGPAGSQWMIVEFDVQSDRNVLDRVLRPALLAVY